MHDAQSTVQVQVQARVQARGVPRSKRPYDEPQRSYASTLELLYGNKNSR